MRQRLHRALSRIGVLAACGVIGACSGTADVSRSSTSTTSTPSSTLSRSSSTVVAASAGWTVMSPAPIDARKTPAAVWTGTELIVWGGLRAGGASPELSDGAAYSPKTDTWRRLAPAPVGMAGVAKAAHWVDGGVLLWAGNGPDGPAVGALYNPYTDAWTPIAPSPLGPREGYASFRTADEILFVGGTRGDMIAKPTAAAYNFRTDQWRVLPDQLRLPDRAQAVRVSSEVLLVGDYYDCAVRSSTCQNVTRRAVALDTDTEAVRPVEIPTAMLDEAGVLLVAASQGRVLWLVGGDAPRLRSYDILRDRWNDSATPPCQPQGVAGAGYSDGLAPMVRNETLLITCDATRTASYSNATDTWQQHDIAFPLAARAGAVQVATSDGIIVWGGSEHRAGNPALADGAIYKPPTDRAPSSSTSTAR